MKTGDVSRSRRLADPARLRWYAQYRAVRFAARMGQRPALEIRLNRTLVNRMALACLLQQCYERHCVRPQPLLPDAACV